MSRPVPAGSGRVRLTAPRPCTVRVGSRFRRAERRELTVAERRDGGSIRTIGLPVLRVFADHPAGRTPVFRLGGGPGLTNLRFGVPPGLASHDVVLVGYRGVDGAVRLDSPEVARALRTDDILSPSARRTVARGARAAAQRLQAAGIDLAGYTVAEAVADLEDARAALGYDTVDLLGESYGTRLALLYAQIHPERVHRSVLLGVNPPGRFIWDPATVDAQLADWGRLWADSGSDRDEDLAGAIRRGVERLPRSWYGRRTDVGKAKILTFALLFQRRTGLVAIDTWQAAARGDPSGVALLATAYDLVVPRLFTWGDFLAKAYSTDYSPDVDYAATLDPPGAALGSPLSLLFFGGGPSWPPTPVSDNLRRLDDCPVETLLVSGALDLSTPPELARREALPHLPRGSHVVLPNTSHVDDMWALQPDATTRLVAGFLDGGKVDAHFDATTPALTPALQLPKLARFATGGIVAAAGAALAAGLRQWRTHRG
jgi:pimeloyl-ACP methyl ester carboxylesterase